MSEQFLNTTCENIQLADIIALKPANIDTHPASSKQVKRPSTYEIVKNQLFKKQNIEDYNLYKKHHNTSKKLLYKPLAADERLHKETIGIKIDEHNELILTSLCPFLPNLGKGVPLEDYILLPPVRKLKYLIRCLRLKEEEIASILEKNSLEIKFILNCETDDKPLQNTEEEQLLEVLDYMYSIADFDIYKYNILLKKSNRYENSNKPAPWDKHGLYQFLMQNKKMGISKAVAWIRRY